MAHLKRYLASLEHHPWQRGAWQGIAIGAGIAVGSVIAGKSCVFVFLGAAAVAVVMAVFFGFLLRFQTARRGRQPYKQRD